MSKIDCAAVLKVLADPTRLAVLRTLLAGPKNVGEINEPLPISQTLLSHHLTVLRKAGLVRARREGKTVLYSLAPDAVVPSATEALELGCCQLVFEKGPHEPRRRVAKRLPQGRAARNGGGRSSRRTRGRSGRRR